MSSSSGSVTRRARGLLLGVLSVGCAVAAAAGCSDDEHAGSPAAVAGKAGGSGHAGSSSGHPAAGGTENGGAATEQGGAAAGASPEGGAPPLGSAGDTHGDPPGIGGDPGLSLDECPSDTQTQPPSLPGVCSATKGWATGDAVPVASGAAPTFVAITPSELTLLWTEAPSSVPVYFVADREAAADDFGEAQELPFGHVLGLSPDGLRLTLLTDDGSLAEATRSARGEAFGNAETGAYETLDADGTAHHLILGDTVIAADDHTLFYSAWSVDDETLYPVHVSQRSGSGAWPVGTPLKICELKAYGAFGPRPTGVSADGLTLFYFDGARGTARAGFRASLAADFSWFGALPDTATPQPNAACDRLYFSPLTGAPGLLVAARRP